jgi:hypothetical protein
MLFGKGIIMNLIQSWKESLSLLAPQNLKPFVLVAVKNVLDVYGLMNKPLTARGNWVAAVIVVILILFTNVIQQFHLLWLDEILLNGIRHFLYFIFLLGMRPSVDIKNWDYFKRYLQKYWYFLVITILFGLTQIYIIPFLFIFYMIFLLFMFDSYNSLQGIVTALKNSFFMILYNFPIFLLLYLVLGFIMWLVSLFIKLTLGFGGLAIATLLYILFAPIQLVFIINLYIKFLHGQSSLYFKQPE